jgi:hypothetical protein
VPVHHHLCEQLCQFFEKATTIMILLSVVQFYSFSVMYINLMCKDECLYVCLYLIQMHISEPIGTKLCTRLSRGLEETIGYVWAHNISPFPLFWPILSGAGADSCAVAGCQRHTTPLLRYIRDAACAGVTSRTVGCAMKMQRSERNACVWKWRPDETGRK